MTIHNPCLHCIERAPGCHTRCPDGLEWDRQEKARRDKIKEAKAKEKDYSEFKVHSVERIKRAIGR